MLIYIVLVPSNGLYTDCLLVNDYTLLDVLVIHVLNNVSGLTTLNTSYKRVYISRSTMSGTLKPLDTENVDQLDLLDQT